MTDITLCCTGIGRHERRQSATTAHTEVKRGMKLKQARIRAGFGRLKASKCIGIDKAQLYRYEVGLVRPGIEAIARISEALGLDPWTIDEFLPSLESAQAAGLVARPNARPDSKNGKDK
jgi:transcriptional regulator with XRE-family HTH domain